MGTVSNLVTLRTNMKLFGIASAVLAASRPQAVINNVVVTDSPQPTQPQQPVQGTQPIDIKVVDDGGIVQPTQPQQPVQNDGPIEIVDDGGIVQPTQPQQPAQAPQGTQPIEINIVDNGGIVQPTQAQQPAQPDQPILISITE